VEIKMKNIIAFAAGVAAFVGFAGVANAQTQEVPVVPTETTFDISPYVDLRYKTFPNGDEFWGGDNRTIFIVGTEATLPWDITVDGRVRFVNPTSPNHTNPNKVDTSAFDLGGFDIKNVNITLTKEVIDGVEVYTSTNFKNHSSNGLIRKSTTLGGRWYFQ
jgi:hypothetical protein